MKTRILSILTIITLSLSYVSCSTSTISEEEQLYNEQALEKKDIQPRDVG